MKIYLLITLIAVLLIAIHYTTGPASQSEAQPQ
ncbi:MAG: hypothetical protein JWP21_2980 [Tardiphaga sp.]|nr:hypothetical protein [Tardiphaga sp.]MDB5549533.1 hypothetical protein [Tardiphaga sp.]MDB5631022.1 hypothetical protein [Tardiphaga sp.]